MRRSVNVAARNNLFLVAARKKKKKERKNLKKFSRQREHSFLILPFYTDLEIYVLLTLEDLTIVVRFLEASG